MKGEVTTKSALLEAAIKMFQKSGFQMTRVSDIVAEAGVAQGTFYNYFRSKEEIFREICNDFIVQLQTLFVEKAEHLFDGESSREVVVNLHQVIRDLFLIYRDNLNVAELLFREGIGNGGLFKEIYESIFSLFLELIEEQAKKAIDKGFIKFEDPEIASVFLFGMFERSLLYFMVIRKNTDLDRLERGMVDFVLNGLSFNHNVKNLS